MKDCKKRSAVGFKIMNWAFTVSIGVSWNKIFAKLGSDYKKAGCHYRVFQRQLQGYCMKLPVVIYLWLEEALNGR